MHKQINIAKKIHRVQRETKKIKRRHTSSGSVSVSGSSLKLNGDRFRFRKEKKRQWREFPKVNTKENHRTNSFLEQDIDTFGTTAFLVTRYILQLIYVSRFYRLFTSFESSTSFNKKQRRLLLYILLLTKVPTCF